MALRQDLKDWVAGSRPRTLPASVGPAVLGGALAYGSGHFDLLKEVLAVFVALFLQIGTNYANDYSDGIRGTDENRNGPKRLVASKTFEPRSVKAAAVISFFVAAVFGLILVFLSHWWLIFVGMASIAAGWYYTGGKRPYGYLGFGEVFTFLFFGLVETVFTFYVQANSVDLEVVAAGVVEGLLITAVLVANNLRDIPTDKETNKLTLAVRLGDSRTRVFYITLVVVSYLLCVALAFRYPIALLSLVSIPAAASAVKVVRSGGMGKDLIAVLGGTSKVVLYVSMLLSLGVVLSKVIL